MAHAADPQTTEAMTFNVSLIYDESNHDERQHTGDQKRSMVAVVIVSVLVLLILLISLLGNLLVIVCIRWDSRLRREIGNVFLVNLSVTDMTSAAVVMTGSLSSVVADGWPFADAWCDLVCLMNYVLIIVSMLSLCFISLDRYAAVVYALKYQVVVTRRRVSLLIAYAWLQGFAFGLAPVLLRWVHFDYWEMVCAIDWAQGGCSTVAYVVVAFTLCFLVPGVVLIVAYVKVMAVAKNVTILKPATLERPKIQSSSLTQQPVDVTKTSVVYNVYEEGDIGKGQCQRNASSGSTKNHDQRSILATSEVGIGIGSKSQSQQNEHTKQQVEAFNSAQSSLTLTSGQGNQQAQRNDSLLQIPQHGSIIIIPRSATPPTDTAHKAERLDAVELDKEHDHVYQKAEFNDEGGETGESKTEPIKQQRRKRVCPNIVSVFCPTISVSPKSRQTSTLPCFQRSSARNKQNYETTMRSDARDKSISGQSSPRQPPHGLTEGKSVTFSVQLEMARLAPATVPEKPIDLRKKVRVNRYSSSSKAIRSLMIVVVAFFICMTPFCVTKLIKVILQEKESLPGYINVAATIFQYCSSAINPLIYGIFRRDFRSVFLKLSRTWFCRDKLAKTFRSDSNTMSF